MKDGSRVSDYDYALPSNLIAAHPVDPRDSSRLMMLQPDGEVRHARFDSLLHLFRQGDLLVVNDSRVIPARLLGEKPTGAVAEVLLLRPWVEVDEESAQLPGRPGHPDEISELAGESKLWEALVRPGGKLKPGRSVVVADDLQVDIVGATEEGTRIVRLVTDATTEEVLERHGRVPLPPYIGRPDEAADRESYQTVYAANPGSVAAPTAGLHFTRPILGALIRRGVRRAPITLHVGIGTFRPLDEADAERPLHEEAFTVPEKTATAIAETRQAGGRVWAVGTTVVRALESVANSDGGVRAGSGWTNLFIRPPFHFQVVDGLITNFHLPRSSLMMLVAAFAGYERTMAVYEEAVAKEYRFYSYGDAMVVPPTP